MAGRSRRIRGGAKLAVNSRALRPAYLSARQERSAGGLEIGVSRRKWHRYFKYYSIEMPVELSVY